MRNVKCSAPAAPQFSAKAKARSFLLTGLAAMFCLGVPGLADKTRAVDFSFFYVDNPGSGSGSGSTIVPTSVHEPASWIVFIAGTIAVCLRRSGRS